jgi:alpha-galactosidase
MGLPEARNAFFDVVKGFMALPGFRCYRQDFNRDPLAHWRDNDAPDRQGITEIKYVMGLYAYWDRIIEAFPDSYRVECAGGGRRIDLETVMRFHVHQKSDYWFHNVPDQSSLFALSHYLPNSLVMTPIDRLDTYTFHSVLASSVCLGWIADAPGFDLTRATELADRYRRVRHLLVGDWYPLTPYHRSREDWLAGQYHRPDLDEGLVLVFRREDTAGRDWQRAFRLRGLDPAATYRLEHDTTRESRQVSGADLAAGLVVQLHDAPASDMIHYRRL